MKLRQYLTETAQTLLKAGVDSPRLCAHVLVSHVLGLDRIACVVQGERELLAHELDSLDALVGRRTAGEPLAHITGSKEFYGRDFLVTPHTLIPRPETELLIDKALEAAGELESQMGRQGTGLYFADLGTGSGCIGITLALELPHWHGLLMDISGNALETARQNAHRLNAQHSVAILNGDMHRAPLAHGAYAMLVSNPPYIAEDERSMVMGEVLAYEPHSALFSPHEGMGHLEAVIKAAGSALKPGGRLLLEHGAAQGASTRRLLRANNFFEDTETHRDLAGFERCTMARRTCS
ncbi:MAG: peptide chain release factor N(5)-glutamine methyltransferase [Desulfovibrio sp.]|uniref:peptide chain release factor N(5)-glutamine methyltransferase n=1 Tax=Desulfovibrio sp. TaxID=885 RepID=UPI0039E2C5E6